MQVSLIGGVALLLLPIEGYLLLHLLEAQARGRLSFCELYRMPSKGGTQGSLLCFLSRQLG